VHEQQQIRRAVRWSRVDLESRRAAFSRRGTDRRSLSRARQHLRGVGP
jgi:hypothetical protein